MKLSKVYAQLPGAILSSDFKRKDFCKKLVLNLGDMAFINYLVHVFHTVVYAARILFLDYPLVSCIFVLFYVYRLM